MSKICSNFAVENEFMTCQNRVTNSHKILILNKIIADLQQVTKINSTVGLSGFESWLSNTEETLWVSFLFSYRLKLRFSAVTCHDIIIRSIIFRPQEAYFLHIQSVGIALVPRYRHNRLRGEWL